MAAFLLAACATEAAPPASVPAPPLAAAGSVQEHPFRLRITNTESSLRPDGSRCAIFDAALETADGSPFPEGRWYLEAPRFAEPVRLRGDRSLPPGDPIGPPPGYSPRVEFLVGGLRAGDDAILRMVVEVPMFEVLEGISERLTLAEDQRIERRFGPQIVTFAGEDGSVSVFLEDRGEEVPEVEFYASAGRRREHAWSMTDARGLPMNDQGGGGSSTISQLWYAAGAVGQPQGVRFPVTLQWRLPRRWRTTMQRFVFENLRIPAAAKAPK